MVVVRGPLTLLLYPEDKVRIFTASSSSLAISHNNVLIALFIDPRVPAKPPPFILEDFSISPPKIPFFSPKREICILISMSSVSHLLRLGFCDDHIRDNRWMLGTRDALFGWDAPLRCCFWGVITDGGGAVMGGVGCMRPLFEPKKDRGGMTGVESQTKGTIWRRHLLICLYIYNDRILHHACSWTILREVISVTWCM